MSGQPIEDRLEPLERLWDAYYRPILSYLYRLVGDQGRAEELAQDVFLRAFRALPRLDAGANHRAWLYRIATNAAYDVLRRRRLATWSPLRDSDADERAETALSSVDEQQAVQQALDQIPISYRSVLVLYAVQGFSVKEIGETMGLSEGAVKTRLFRAREFFRRAYGHEP